MTAERDAMKTGYSIKTWKMRLFCPEKQMIETTEALYREAVAFYYELLKESEELWAENLLTIQGHLEKLTVPGRKRTKVHPARRKAPRLLSEICHEQSCNGSKDRSKRRKLSRKDRC